MAGLPTPTAERALVDRCLRGDEAAHEELFCRYCQPLTRALNHRYRSDKRHAQIAEELLELVVAHIVAHDYRPLAKFNPKRGWLMDLLVLLARHERSAQRRSRSARQQNREVTLVDEAWEDSNPSDSVYAMKFEDFRLTLTAEENAYLTKCIAQQTQSSTPGPMTAHERYVRRCVREKAREFFQERI
jgi:hypothetical protein